MIRATVAALRVAASTAVLVTEKRNTIPILSYLLLRSGPNGVSLRGTNLERTVTATVAPSEVVAEGDVAIRAKPLVDLLRLLPPDDEVSIEADKIHAVVRSGSLTIRMALLPAEDFPSDNLWKASRNFELPAGELLRLLAAVAYCVSTEETRYYLNGVYLHIMGEEFASVATDGHRLMVAKAALPAGAEGWRGEIIPRETVKLLRRMLSAVPPDTPVKVSAGENKMSFSAGGWTVFSKCIDGTFPEVARVIPTEQSARFRLVVDAPAKFRVAIDQVRVVADSRSDPVRVCAHGMAASLAMTAHEGESSVVLPADVAHWDGTPLGQPVGFQARYIKAAAAAFPSGFTLQISDGSQPIRIDGKEGLAVLMPMRI